MILTPLQSANLWKYYGGTNLMESYTCLEAAEALGVTDRRVRVLCRTGRLGRKHGRAWLIYDDDLKQYLDAGPMKPGKKVGGK